MQSNTKWDIKKGVDDDPILGGAPVAPPSGSATA